jgi:MSHA biogenesis protein MshE
VRVIIVATSCVPHRGSNRRHQRPALKPDVKLELVALAEPDRKARRPQQRMRIGDMLVAAAVITPAQLQAALDEQRRSGRKLGQVLIEDGISDEPAIARALAQQLKVPYVDLTLDQVDAKIARLLPEAQARRLRVLPIDQVDGVLRVGMADPTDLKAHDDAQALLGREIDLVAVTDKRLNAVLDRLYAKSEEISGFAKDLERELGTSDAASDSTLLAGAAVEDAPVAKLLQSLIEDALRARASDIHVEPQERKLTVRFRVDGALVVHLEAETRIAPAVLQRLKLVAGLDIAERRLPQDGRFVVKVRGQAVDLRISTMPTQFGEAAVLRLLPQSSSLLGLERLGMPARILDKVRGFIAEPHGMLVVTGPTGSGKTSTLYAILAELNKPDTKIVTVEDPVEYRLAGINQVQVHEKIGLSFATVLRSTLRQDPDVVLVGEMRDRDTVETGLRAAMTGHMVLSTLHTRNASSTPVRLIDMGAPLFLVATSLRMVLAQRLVRTICAGCTGPHDASPQELAFLRAVMGTESDAVMAVVASAAPLRLGRGCVHCAGSGFLGRRGVYELLDMTNDVVHALHGGDSNRFLVAARREIGTLSLARHACELALAGMTTVGEAMRTVGRTLEG